MAGRVESPAYSRRPVTSRVGGGPFPVGPQAAILAASRPEGPVCLPVLMRQEGRSPRQAMPMSGVVSLDDPRLDQLVASLAREG